MCSVLCEAVGNVKIKCVGEYRVMVFFWGGGWMFYDVYIYASISVSFQLVKF